MGTPAESERPSAPDKNVWCCWLAIHLDVPWWITFPYRTLRALWLFLSLWSDILLMVWNAEGRSCLASSGKLLKWVMKTLPADTLVCACEALFRVKLLLWPPVHHNLIRLHIFPPLPQRSRLLTPELISKEDLLFSRQLLCSEDTASAVIYAQVHNMTLLYLYCKNTSVSRSFLHPLGTVFPKSSEIVIEVPAAVAQHSPLVYSLHFPRRVCSRLASSCGTPPAEQQLCLRLHVSREQESEF